MANIPGTPNPDILTGTALADLIDGLASDDVLYAFDGNDSLLGGTGDDILYGGSGDDNMDGGAGEDIFYGQSGLDTVTYASAVAGLTLNLADNSLSTGDAAADFFLSVENFILTSFNDTFIGNALGNQASGGDGNDLLQGFDGNDHLFGDAGNDTLEGGAGADTLNGGQGADQASYATSTGGIVIDFVTSANTTGDARFDSYIDIEAVMLTAFDDRAQLSSTIRKAYGGEGNDAIFGSTGRDTMLGGEGNDSPTGGTNSDLLQGDAGDDFLDGGSGNDTLLGGADNDRLAGGSGADVMDGGAGDDLVTYAGKVTVNLATPSSSTGFAQGDTFAGIEAISFLGGTGSRYVGNATSLSVLLFSGSLTAIAGSGAETFVATAGSMAVSYATTTQALIFSVAGVTIQGSGGAFGDTLNGVGSLTMTGKGDVFDAAGLGGPIPLPATIFAGNGNDALTLRHGGTATIDAGGGNDTVTGQMDGGTLALGSGTDTVDMAVQGDISLGTPLIITAGSGNDSLTIETLGASLDVSGDAGDDTMVLLDAGSLGSYNVDGGDGNDTITTFSAGATLEGGLGDDTLTVTAMGRQEAEVSGGDGSDVIEVSALGGFAQGGAGNDQLTFILFLSGAGEAVLDGGTGDDTLTIGGEFAFGTTLAGNQAVFRGGAGNDTLVDVTPANGINEPFVFTQFAFATGWGNDTVTGFDDGVDLIRFDSTAGGGLDDFADLTISGDATQTLITFGTDSILISGLDRADFTAGDVTFTRGEQRLKCG